MNFGESSGCPNRDSADDAQHPTDISWQALAPALSLSSVALVLVITRWYIRRLIVGRTGPDDYIITLSMVRRVFRRTS